MKEINDSIIHFELNDWIIDESYPDCEPINTWIDDNKFCNKTWVNENKLVVTAGVIDMSINWLISAPKSWVERKCPILLSTTCSKFLRKPDKFGKVMGNFGWIFPEYNSNNIGIHYVSKDV